jgi:ElaB/YqjD/DUF883 family membrane-anchored ribosome-binding protein
MKRNHTAEPAHDFGTLAEDAKALLAATAEVAEDKVVAARERLSMALERGREAWGTVQDRAVQGAKATDKTIRNHPYQAIGIAFGVGALLGFLITRRGN